MKKFNPLIKEGFTLIEVLLAVAISAVIIISLTTAFWRGLDAWNRTKHLTKLSGDFRFGMDVLQKELENSIKLPLNVKVDSFSISKNGDRMTFFTLKRLKEDKIPHIYKVSYHLVKNPTNLLNSFILKRASKEMKNFDDLSYEFKPSDYKQLMTQLTGEKLKFQGSLFGGIIKICEKKIKKEDEKKKILERIRLMRKGQQQIIFPGKTIYVFTRP